mmetsp:Transcript_6690/g.15235  ORF Transcript_6690/g.15235 Transcript_6690/m.15235 type:complete len:214 (-) Transcript_6690:1841-2482(-)
MVYLFGILNGMRLQNLKSFLNLGTQCLGTFQQVEQFRIIHFQQHACNLTGKFRLGVVDERVETFANHVLLDLGCGRGECCGGQLIIRGGRWSTSSVGSWCTLLLRRLHGSRSTGAGGHATLRRGAGIACLRVEFHGGWSRRGSTTTTAIRTGATSSSLHSPSSSSLGSSSPASRLSGHHAVSLHGSTVSTWSTLSSLHSVASSSSHHLGHGGV